ncbi:unannotated protein [freshwater metagenome]|uniref:Unannotated protein n=1 Tax=freshwater metagenome TaxID=449393 RepID=A0A6J6A315_9ZZZZ
MNSGNDVTNDEFANHFRNLEMVGMVKSWERSTAMATSAGPTRTGNLWLGNANEHQTPLINQANSWWPTIERIDHTEHSDHRSGINIGALRLVIQTDVSTDDRRVKRHAGFRHAIDGLRQLPHDLGMFRVTEVQTVHNSQRTSTYTRKIQ